MQLKQDVNMTYSSRLNSRHIHLEQQSSITSETHYWPVTKTRA